MSMTRTDFKAIAEIIRKYNIINHSSIGYNSTFDALDFYHFVQELTSYFKKANPTFDKGKFLKAAGYYQE